MRLASSHTFRWQEVPPHGPEDNMAVETAKDSLKVVSMIVEIAQDAEETKTQDSYKLKISGFK